MKKCMMGLAAAVALVTALFAGQVAFADEGVSIDVTGVQDGIAAQSDIDAQDYSFAGHWVKSSNGKWWFSVTSGNYPDSFLHDGFFTISGNDYFFNAGGWMVTGWLQYYYSGGGYDWYYFFSNGHQAYGWQQVGGKWYYFHPSYNGVMISDRNWDGSFYYNGYYYAFNSSGHMLTGWFKDGTGKWCWADSKGHVTINGWVSSGGKWYYISEWYMVSSRDMTINGVTYNFGPSGDMRANCWIEYTAYNPPIWSYAKSNGALVEYGWYQIGGKWYWFEDTVMCKNYYTPDGHYVGSNGAMVY